MRIKTKAIVISALRYQDKSLIVKCFTASSGLKSYFIRDAFSSKRNTQKAIYFQPLNILEIEAEHKNKGKLEYIKEVKFAYNYFSIGGDITKSSIIIFLSEILHNIIREEEENIELYTFLETAFLWLDNHDYSENFHLVLLLEITKFLGFYPNVKDSGYNFFEMHQGCFSNTASLSCINEEETKLFKRLINLKFDNSGKAFHVNERRNLLKILLDYYSYHLDNFIKPKSLEVLKEIYN
ncbi:DNA repair protein RecO [Flavobacterium sp. MK4S-17]|uniref:DNA repair protein RecO n=1 Tax=Flavobacterium sp. MK4S-17 TaxID=2543737 RepID=UPI00135CC24F|nr:DNA repair protein RecO [Flavobacterium sp. MK4S-17]